MRHALFALTFAATPALADLQLENRLPGLDLVALSDLPKAPGDQGETESCTHLFVESPATPAGQGVAAEGWHVTAEAPLGDYTAVSFIGSATPATSGTCDLLDGNIGIFSADRLVALLYSTEAGGSRIGRIRPFGDGLRVVSGEVLPSTLGDIVTTGDRITVTEPAGEEPVCNGTALVPGIEDLQIDEARNLLIAAGWKPVPGDPAQQALGFAQEIAARGVPEVEDCSGTGFGFCSYGYAGAAGTLSVVTVGEGSADGGLPFVSSYAVACR